mgnify:CR=1 FL=1
MSQQIGDDANNGLTETTHIQVSPPKEEQGPPADGPAIEQFFTATGYLPNDVYLDSMNETDSPLIFDSEFTHFVHTKLPRIFMYWVNYRR